MKTNRARHERENKSLLFAYDVNPVVPFPSDTIWGDGIVVWPHNIASNIVAEVGAEDWTRLGNETRKEFDPGESLEKNCLFISRRMELAWAEGHTPGSLVKPCGSQ